MSQYCQILTGSVISPEHTKQGEWETVGKLYQPRQKVQRCFKLKELKLVKVSTSKEHWESSLVSLFNEMSFIGQAYVVGPLLSSIERINPLTPFNHHICLQILKSSKTEDTEAAYIDFLFRELNKEIGVKGLTPDRRLLIQKLEDLENILREKKSADFVSGIKFTPWQKYQFDRLNLIWGKTRDLRRGRKSAFVEHLLDDDALSRTTNTFHLYDLAGKMRTPEQVIKAALLSMLINNNVRFSLSREGRPPTRRKKIAFADEDIVS